MGAPDVESFHAISKALDTSMHWLAAEEGPRSRAALISAGETDAPIEALKAQFESLAPKVPYEVWVEASMYRQVFEVGLWRETTRFWQMLEDSGASEREREAARGVLKQLADEHGVDLADRATLERIAIFDAALRQVESKSGVKLSTTIEPSLEEQARMASAKRKRG